MSNPFPLHTIESAPEAVRDALQTMQGHMGFLPTKAAKLAEVILSLALKAMINHTNTLAHTPPNPEFGDAVRVRREDLEGR